MNDSTPAWLFPDPAGQAAGAGEAEAFLERLDAIDRRLVLMLHGHGLDMGDAAYAVHIDPAIAYWRIRRAFESWDQGSGPGTLERGVAAWLGEGSRREAETASLPPEVAERMRVCLQGGRGEASHDGRSGLGVGSLVLILLAVAAFIVYGAARDVNPLWRGQDMLRVGDFERARLAFSELGETPEARAWTAITWLSEGAFDQGVAALAEPATGLYLGAFRPMDETVEPLDTDSDSPALLPRGFITTPRPTFSYRAGRAGRLVLEGQSLGDPPRPLPPVLIELPDTTGGVVQMLPFPSGLPELEPGHYLWTVPGGVGHEVAFTLLPSAQRREIHQRMLRTVTYEVPNAARTFLRGHFLLRNRLYTQAGRHFATLAARFPEEAYPRILVQEIADALRVDPSALLR